MWEQLSRHSPTVGDIVKVGEKMEQDIDNAESLYKTMICISQGAMVRRAYADFLLEIRNDTFNAMDLYSKADRIDERNAK